MSDLKQKGKNKVQAEAEAKELDIDALEQVSGGVSLRDADKVETTDVSDDTRSKV